MSLFLHLTVNTGVLDEFDWHTGTNIVAANNRVGNCLAVSKVPVALILRLSVSVCYRTEHDSWYFSDSFNQRWSRGRYLGSLFEILDIQTFPRNFRQADTIVTAES